MLEWLYKRLEFHKKSFRVLWLPVMFLWTLFSTSATVRDNFFSLRWQQRLATLNLLPKWPWYVWVIGLLVITLIALVEGSYRAGQPSTASQFERLAPEFAKEVSLEHPEVILWTEWPRVGLDGVVDPNAPPMRFVVPMNQPYERPFVVSNESSVAAHNVKIRDVAIGGLTAKFRILGTVRKGEDRPSVPDVGNVDTFATRSLHALFERAFSASHVRHIEQSIIVDYEDSKRRQWETEQVMTYDFYWRTATFRLEYVGPKRTLSERIEPVPPMTLSQQMIELGREMSRWIDDQGERPDEEEIWKKYKHDGVLFAEKYQETIQVWDERISAGYWKLFKVRATDIRNDLAIRGVVDQLLDSALMELEKSATERNRFEFRKLVERIRYVASTLND